MYSWKRSAIISNVLFRGWLKPKWEALLMAILMPVKLIHDDFITFRKAKNRNVRMKFQVIYMENYLNKAFNINSYDLAERENLIAAQSIFSIENTAVRDSFVLFQEIEGIQEVDLYSLDESWDDSSTFNEDDIVTLQDTNSSKLRVFKAKVDNLSTDPLVDTTNWEEQREEKALNTLEDDKATTHFIVRVPKGYHDFSIESDELSNKFRKEVKVKMEYYLHAGKVYSIENY